MRTETDTKGLKLRKILSCEGGCNIKCLCCVIPPLLPLPSLPFFSYPHTKLMYSCMKLSAILKGVPFINASLGSWPQCYTSKDKSLIVTFRLSLKANFSTFFFFTLSELSNPSLNTFKCQPSCSYNYLAVWLLQNKVFHHQHRIQCLTQTITLKYAFWVIILDIYVVCYNL